MRKYEIMYIMQPDLDEASRKSVVDTIHSVLINNGAQIVKVEDWGSRDLAYEIRKQKRGYYMIINVETESSAAIKEFERIVNINENILRFLVVKLDA